MLYLGRMMKGKNEYTIKLKNKGLYNVISPKGIVYEVDLLKPSCSCKSFKFTKKGKRTKYCKHMKWCIGLG